MSAKQSDKKLPITIAVVVVLLVGVVALNINTFGAGGGGGDSSRDYRLQAHPQVPSDMGQMVNYEEGLQPSKLVANSNLVVASLGRDPFFPIKAQPKTVTRARTGSGKRSTKSSTKSKVLECSAIMLGGKRPMAIINGEGRYPGDKIRGMTLTKIDADGVTFRKSDGSNKRLPVGVHEDEDANYRVVTRAQEFDDQGSTRLISQ